MRFPLFLPCAAGLLAASGIETTSAGLILNGNGVFPASPAIVTSTADNAERDVRPATPARDNSQSFQVPISFQLDAIYIEYESPTGGAYVDGTFNLRLYPVADVNAAGNPAPAPSGTDLLNIPITLDATARAAAGFTGSSGEPASTLVFDLTGTDEITLPATTGTAGYVLQFDLADSGLTAGGFFTWRGASGNPYASGRWFDATSSLSTQDGTLAITAVPEPGTALLCFGGMALAGLIRPQRRS